MGGEWIKTTLEKTVILKNGKGLKNSFYIDDGKYTVWGANGQIARTNQVLNKQPVIVIGRVGAYCGSIHAVNEPSWVTDNAIIAIPKEGNDFKFLYYMLKYLRPEKTSIGSAQPLITQSGLKNLKHLRPSLSEQICIAHILGTLDDKIELNRKINETLEAMAQALFKSWFVDFDPVIDRALVAGKSIPEELTEKAERRKQLGDKRKQLPEDIASLFPDEFENSELGWIPKGWGVGCISDIAIKINKSVKPEDLNPDEPYIALKHMPRESISLRYWVSAKGIESNKVQFKKYNILFGKLRPYFHKVGVAAIDGVCSTDIVVVSQNEDKWFGLLLGYLSSKKFVDYTAGTSTGTKMPRTNWRDMSRYKITIPHNEIAKVFNLHVLTVVQQIHEHIYEYHTLSNIRDILLPKLISGELRVPDAENLVEEAGR